MTRTAAQRLSSFDPLSLALSRTFARLREQSAAPPEVKDGKRVARLIGEFSAGKSRLVSELLRDYVGEELRPVSSLKAETLLDLRVTWDERPQLWLEERPGNQFSEWHATRLEKFPRREDLPPHLGSNDDEMRKKYRLRLGVPHPIFLATTDGIAEERDGTAWKFSLIDTRGVNEKDVEDLVLFDEESSELAIGLIYVTFLDRLDSKLGRRILQKAVEYLRQSNEIVFQDATPTLLIYVTRCPEAKKDDARKRIEEQLQEAGVTGGIAIHIECLDFDSLGDQERQQFAATFWKNLLSGWQGWTRHELKPPTWLPLVEPHDIRSALAQVGQCLDQARDFLAPWPEGQRWLSDVNATKLRLRRGSERRKYLNGKWQKALGVSTTPPPLVSQVAVLPPDTHPLAIWWNETWCPPIVEAVKAVDAFVTGGYSAIDAVSDEEEDIEQFLTNRLGALLARAKESMRAVELHAPATLFEALPRLSNRECFSALLSLQLMELALPSRAA